MGKNTSQTFSIQAQLIRELQAQEGHEPCYATPVAEHCSQKAQEKCCWQLRLLSRGLIARFSASPDRALVSQ